MWGRDMTDVTAMVTAPAGKVTAREFLERVLPWPGPEEPGYVNLHWLVPDRTGKKMWAGKPFRTVDKFVSMMAWLQTRPQVTDLYFCLSVQNKTKVNKQGKLQASRQAADAVNLKAIWLDVDVKADKGYATLPEALRAISKFIEDAKLPLRAH